MEIIGMTCRQCGGSLKISKDADQIICQHCGTEYLISFNEGAISVKLLSEGLKKIQVSTDKTASELALVRIKKEKEQVAVKIQNQVTNPLTSSLSGFGDIYIPKELLLNYRKLYDYLLNQLDEEQKAFVLLRNQERVNKLKTILPVVAGLLKEFEEIIKDENFHLNQVRSK
jgi:flagellin-specific chaperone FliS